MWYKAPDKLINLDHIEYILPVGDRIIFYLVDESSHCVKYRNYDEAMQEYENLMEKLLIDNTIKDK